MKKTIFLIALLFSFHVVHAQEFISHGSYGSMGESKQVLGVYERAQITDASLFPYRTIGQFSFAGCTGTLIGPRHVLTAGHCVYNFESKQWKNDLRFFPGKTSQNHAPYGEIGWKKVFIQKDYITTGIKKFDFAVVELEKSIGDTIGWSGYKILQLIDYNTDIRMTGYPADKDRGTLWTVVCPGSVVDSVMTYKCDTYGGMSGSAIYSIADLSTLENLSITAIHTWGNEKINGGVVINSTNFDLISAWKNNKTTFVETVIYEKKNINPWQIQ